MHRVRGGGRTGVIASLALLIAAAVIVVLVVRSSPSAASGADGRSAGTTGGSATVRRRTLVATDTESGTLSYAGAQTVYNRLGGTVTWLPPVGRTIKPGGVLYRIDGRPVILMSGSSPAYRALSAADVDGHDVLELNRNLKRLGFDATEITADDIWQPATSLGVEELQESLGEEPTGEETLGQVVFLPGPQLVSALDTTVGSTGAGGGSSAAAQESSTAPFAASAEFVSSTRPATTTTSTTPLTSTTSTTSTKTTSPSDGAARALSALARELKAETTQLKAATAALKATANSAHNSSSSSGSHHSSSSSHHSSGGSTGGSAQAILQTTSTRLVVTVDLSASSQAEARVGERVSVEMPAGNSVRAKIIAVSRIAQSSSSGSGGGQSAGQGSGSGGGSSSTVPVTIALIGPHRTAGLDQAAVSVAFVSQRARHVLSVPVTALVATSGTRYALQQASVPHTLIPVTVGLFAAGYVQVSGSGVHPGLAVTDSQG
jgi:hypothetical protein